MVMLSKMPTPQLAIHRVGLTHSPLTRYYCLSLLDKHHHPDIDFEQGMKILGMCSDELKRRLPIDFKGLYVKVVTKDGIRDQEFVENQNVLPA